MKLKKTLFLSLFSLPFALMACGDEVTKVTEVNERVQISVLKPGDKLSKQSCDSTNAGKLIYVEDSSAVFTCNGKSWESLDGENGENAVRANGEPGQNGVGCTAKNVKKEARSGYELTCGKTVVDTIWNGADGEDGKNLNGDRGKDGSWCTAQKVETDNRTGYELTCDDAVVDTLWNGKDGENSTEIDEVRNCIIENDSTDASTVTLVCGQGDDAVRTTFIVPNKN